jgi:LysM repeat protein
VKVKVFLILVGVAALHLLLIAGFAITGGCKSPEIFAERKFIPAEGSAAATPVAPVVETKPVVTADAVKAIQPDVAMDKPLAPVKPVAAVGGTYTVQSGDTLGKIARKHGVSVQSLAAANNLSTQKMLKVGQVLTVPGGSSAVAPSAPVEHKKATHKKKATEAKAKVAKDVKKEDSKKETAKADDKSATAATADSSTYVVKQGDSIWKIAKKLNVKGTDLAKENNITTKANLKVGQKLKVPGAAKKAEAAPAVAPADATAESKKAETAADDILKKVSDPTAKPIDASATPTDATNTAPVVDTKAAPGAAASAAPAPVAPIGKTDTVEVSKDIEIGKFAQQYGIKVDDIKKLNNDIPKDGILKAGKIIIIPSAE